ncbi:MAG: hypothetical protein ACFFDN_19920 [Candidatus Hodarchaeota archaeon]
MEGSKRDTTYTEKGGKFKKGNPGRPKGAKDKFTNLKEDILQVYNKLGGSKGVYEWVNKDKARRLRWFYDTVFKMLPSNLQIDDMNVKLIIEKIITNELKDGNDK